MVPKEEPMTGSPALMDSTIWLPILAGLAAFIANVIRFCKSIRNNSSIWKVALVQCCICLYVIGVYIYLALGGFADLNGTARLFFRAAMMMATVGILTEALMDL